MEDLKNDVEVRVVVRRFEQCEYGLAEFDHAHHLCVGMAYLHEAGFDAALERLRLTLQRFSGHHGKTGYHETLTRFWLMRLEEIRQREPARALWQDCNTAVQALQDKDLVFQYYDRERLMSDEARHQWVHPNKTPDSCLSRSRER